MVDKIEKAYLKFEKGPKLECHFNPERLAITKTNVWKDEGGVATDEGQSTAPKQVPVQEFSNAAPGTMELELMFDTTKTGTAVTNITNKILEQMEVKTLPKRSVQMGNLRPPYVIFGWGTNVSWPAVIEKATVEFQFFSSSGVPLRAKVNLSLKQAMPSKAYTRQNPTSGTPMPHRVHRVQRGETLDRISAQYYGDSTRWRMLAAANGIEDPLGIRPGSLISVPELGSG